MSEYPNIPISHKTRERRFADSDSKVWMADLFDRDGVSAYWRYEELLNRMTIPIVEKILTTEAFAKFTETTGLHLGRAFFVARCKRMIRPMAINCTLAEFLPAADPRSPTQVTTSDQLLATLLLDVWPSTKVTLLTGRTTNVISGFNTSVRGLLRALRGLIPSNGGLDQVSNRPAVGIEIDALNLGREIAPYRFEGIDPGRVVLCLAHPYYSMSNEDISSFEQSGMKWVSLASGSVASSRTAWRPGMLRNSTAGQYRKSKRQSQNGDDLERWVADLAITQLRRIDYWRAFISRHNIRAFLLHSGGAEEKLAKRIACHAEGAVLLTSQRSHFASRGDTVGNRTSDVSFCWGDPDAAVGKFNENYISYSVKTGFNGDAHFPEAKGQGLIYRQRLTERGARFVITFYDNAIYPYGLYSNANMVDMYSHFLKWVLSSEDRGLILKPKNSDLSSRYREISELLQAAEATGRCVTLPYDVGPQVAAFASDLCVGIGHSTAVMIAAITGCRSVHCDISGTPYDPMEDWGKGKVYFRDLNELSRSIDRHIDDPANSHLGDYSSFADDLDPYKDGRSNDRMQMYIESLLTAFDQGADREEAMRVANENYASVWGQDKVVSTNGPDQTNTREMRQLYSSRG